MTTGPAKGEFVPPPDMVDKDETWDALPQQEEFWRAPVRFGSVPVESTPLGWDRRRGFRKLYPHVMLPTQVVERVTFGHPELQPNRLFWGDNLHVMRQLPSESIDLIYIDPPFFSGKQYNVIFGDQNELRSFSDIWEGGMPGYLIWLNARLYEMKRLLKKTGSVDRLPSICVSPRRIEGIIQHYAENREFSAAFLAPTCINAAMAHTVCGDLSTLSIITLRLRDNNHHCVMPAEGRSRAGSTTPPEDTCAWRCPTDTIVRLAVPRERARKPLPHSFSQPQLLGPPLQEALAAYELLLQVGELLQVDGIVTVEAVHLQAQKETFPVDGAGPQLQVPIVPPVVVRHVDIADVGRQLRYTQR